MLGYVLDYLCSSTHEKGNQCCILETLLHVLKNALKWADKILDKEVNTYKLVVLSHIIHKCTHQTRKSTFHWLPPYSWEEETLPPVLFKVFFGRSWARMFGRTPPCGMVTPARSLFSSSSFLTASWMCLGRILVFLFSRAAFPASSRISAVKYSKTAAR